jgi:hypothetical protein
MRRQRHGGRFMRRLVGVRRLRGTEWHSGRLASHADRARRRRSAGRSLPLCRHQPGHLVVKLYGSTRAREAVRVEEQDGDDPDADVTPDDVAAVIRILRAHEVADHAAGEPAPDSHSNGRAAR